jgi:hypothetical protein
MSSYLVIFFVFFLFPYLEFLNLYESMKKQEGRHNILKIIFFFYEKLYKST